MLTRPSLVLLVLATAVFAASQPPPSRSSSRGVPASLSARPKPMSIAPGGPPGVAVTEFSATVRCDGPAARIEQHLVLRNPGNTEAEFDLLFPLGTGSVVTGLELSVGGKVLEGRIYGKEEARRIFAEIVRKRRDPALLESYGEAVFHARVFPIPAGGTQTVRFVYTRILDASMDGVRLHLPLTAFRRGPGGVKLEIEGTIVSEHVVTTLYSPTHQLRVAEAHASLDGGRPVARFRVAEASVELDEDFVLFFKTQPKPPVVDVTVLSEQPDPKDAGYFLAVVSGGNALDVSPEPKDVVFVLDRSGSMQGEKIQQAKQALKFLVERLRPEDRFEIVTYSDSVTPLRGSLAPLARTEIGGVLGAIDAIQAQGGTNIAGALEVALGLFGANDRTNQLVFLTDGLPTVGERDMRKLCALAKERNQKAARCVVFGVGFDVNGAFLDRLAVQNHGLSEYCLPNENLEQKIPGFYAQIQSPLVLDATVSVLGAKTFDVFPKEIGDLYAGRQLLVVGRYDAGSEAVVRVRGRRGRENVDFAFPITLAKDGATPARDLVSRIWAAKKVGYLVDEIRLNGESKELVDEIVRLGTKFAILTEYTSFLAVEEADLADAGANRERARKEVAGRAGVEAGAHGVAQAANSKKLQRGEQVQGENCWLDEQGKSVSIGGCRSAGGRALFQRGRTWQDASVAKDAKAEEIDVGSDAFFELLDQNPGLNRAIARTGDLTLDLGGRIVRLRAGD